MMGTRPRGFFVVAVIAAWLAAAVGAAAQTTNAAEAVVVYPLQSGDPAVVVDVLRGFLGGNVKVVYDATRNAIIVMAPAAIQAQAAAIVRKLDVPPRNVRVEVRFRRHTTDFGSGARVSGPPMPIVQNSGPNRSRISFRPQAGSRTVQASENTVQTLMVMSGRDASLRIGESVPYLDWIVEYGLAHKHLVERIDWRNVGSSLVVQPTVIGDGPAIRIRLIPELSGFVGADMRRIRMASLATEVVVENGRTISIGSIAQNREFFSRFLVGSDRGAAADTLDISLTPYIINAAGTPLK